MFNTSTETKPQKGWKELKEASVYNDWVYWQTQDDTPRTASARILAITYGITTGELYEIVKREHRRRHPDYYASI